MRLEQAQLCPGTAFLLAEDADSSPMHHNALRCRIRCSPKPLLPSRFPTVMGAAYANRFIDEREPEARFGYPGGPLSDHLLRYGGAGGQPLAVNIRADTGFWGARTAPVPRHGWVARF